MDIKVEDSGSFVVLRPDGELTMDQVEKLETALGRPELTAPKSRVAVDLTSVPAIDSTGLGVLINLVTRSRLREGRVIIVGPNRFVRGVMEVTQLDTWFEICDTMAEAEQRFAE